jgi:diguanylate cyclase (GGDEF)-like protein
MGNNIKILLVDDRKENLVTLRALLESPGLEILTATSGNEALGLMLEHELAVVLLDVQMPDMDGFEVAELMRRTEKTKYIPIIFVTAISKDKQYIFKGYETGAVDYLFKPLDPVVLKSKINIFLELSRNKQELEESKRQIEAKNKRLREISIRDGLTGLYNHLHFEEMLSREFELARRNETDLSCFMMDLDYFKDVNDTFGHTFGDFVLKSFSELGKRVIRKTDVFARYGGEEFVLLLPHTGLDGARVLAEKFRQKAEAYLYQHGGHSRRVTISIGISSYFFHRPQQAADLISFADKALYRAKAAGRNQVRVYLEEELLKAGTLNKQPPEMFFSLRERLKKILENTKKNILASFEIPMPYPVNNTPENVDIKSDRESNRRTQEILELMGERLGLSPGLVQTFKRAAILHDLFKSFHGDKTALEPGSPDKQEQMDIEDYPFMLEELTRTFDIFAEERVILRCRHENYDGSGYPEGLKGTEGPIGARLFALVDAFVAMTFNRCSRPVLKPGEVVDELVKQAGKQFDPMLVNHLLEIIKEKQLLPVSKERLREAQKEIRSK